MGDLERIIARRSEPDALAEELAKQQEVQAEREELLVAERVLNRLAEADRAEAETAVAASPAPARAAGRAVLLIPHRGESVDEAASPGTGDGRRRCQAGATAPPNPPGPWVQWWASAWCGSASWGSVWRAAVI
jgi:hypothetical protein